MRRPHTAAGRSFAREVVLFSRQMCAVKLLESGGDCSIFEVFDGSQNSDAEVLAKTSQKVPESVGGPLIEHDVDMV